MNDLLHVSEVDKHYISLGVLNVMEYYEVNDIEYPKWLFSKFVELPRTFFDLENMSTRFCIEVTHVTNMSYLYGEMTVWIIENLSYRWYKNGKMFYFENKEDAVAFKLRWL